MGSPFIAFSAKKAVEAVIGEPVSVSNSLFRGKIQGNLPLEAGVGYPALALANKFKAFPSNSLRIKTGNFAD
jgi:hypothetical protein